MSLKNAQIDWIIRIRVESLLFLQMKGIIKEPQLKYQLDGKVDLYNASILKGDHYGVIDGEGELLVDAVDFFLKEFLQLSNPELVSVLLDKKFVDSLSHTLAVTNELYDPIKISLVNVRKFVESLISDHPKRPVLLPGELPSTLGCLLLSFKARLDELSKASVKVRRALDDHQTRINLIFPDAPVRDLLDELLDHLKLVKGNQGPSFTPSHTVYDMAIDIWKISNVFAELHDFIEKLRINGVLELNTSPGSIDLRTAAAEISFALSQSGISYRPRENDILSRSLANARNSVRSFENQLSSLVLLPPKTGAVNDYSPLIPIVRGLLSLQGSSVAISSVDSSDHLSEDEYKEWVANLPLSEELKAKAKKWDPKSFIEQASQTALLSLRD